MTKNLPCVSGQKIQIGNDIIIEFFELNGQLKMNICASKHIEVHQKELYDIIKSQKMQEKITGKQLLTISNNEKNI